MSLDITTLMYVSKPCTPLKPLAWHCKRPELSFGTPEAPGATETPGLLGRDAGSFLLDGGESVTFGDMEPSIGLAP